MKFIYSRIKVGRALLSYKLCHKSPIRMTSINKDFRINTSVYPLARREPIIENIHGKKVYFLVKIN